MPSASSSAMCLSRATGSRPVQPAITSWSIASVSGVGPLRASTVKVRSNTYQRLQGDGKFEDAPVGAAWCRQHEANRDLALAMGGQRDRAAVDQIDQRAVAQGPNVRRREGLVVGEIGDPRRGVGRGRGDQGVLGG